MASPLRVAVIGVGHLGSRHAQIYARMPGVRLAAVCDRDAGKAAALARMLRCEAVTDYRRILGLAAAASLAVPTSLHGAIGCELLRAGIHLLVEKPIAATLAEADALIRAAARRRLVLQIGHVERFNAAIHAALHHLKRARFLEVHRLSPYPFRGTDVSVILDVMIHDLDLVLAMVRSRPARIDAIGIPVLSSSEDIANARIQFASGCVANLTASRISDEPVRRFRVFQRDSYLSIDAMTQAVKLARIRRGKVERVHLPVSRRPPLQQELAAFIRCVRTRTPPLVSGVAARRALELALRIERAMRR